MLMLCRLYGEIALPHFVWLLSNIMAAREGEVFYDLGSGSGKVVAAAAMTCAFRSCTGIELLDGLHDMSMMALTGMPRDKLLCNAISVGILSSLDDALSSSLIYHNE
jgi:precorrin-6B methylase 2